MNRYAAFAVVSLVGFASGAVWAREYPALRATIGLAASSGAVSVASGPANVAAAPPAARARPHASDPALELLASNPYEGQIDAYEAALNLDGDHPLLEDPYADAMRFANPYENTVGVANPYVDALRESEIHARAHLDNPYTKELRDRNSVGLLDNPYSRRH